MTACESWYDDSPCGLNAISVNGLPVKILGVNITEKPINNGDTSKFLEFKVGEELRFCNGINKDSVMWSADGRQIGSYNIQTSYAFNDPGLKEIKASFSNGNSSVFYLFIEGLNSDHDVEIDNKALSDTYVSTSTEVPNNEPDDNNPTDVGKKNRNKVNRASYPSESSVKKNGEENEVETKSSSKRPKKEPQGGLAENPDFDKIGKAGYSNVSCKGKKSVNQASSIIINPSCPIVLSYIRVYSEFNGKAIIIISADDNRKPIIMNRILNENSTFEINFQSSDYIMRPGVEYMITIKGVDNDFKLSDLSECNSGNGSNSQVSLSYNGGGAVFYDLWYKY